MKFERFGEMGSAEEINLLAVNLRKEGDYESIRVLATENGLDDYLTEEFIRGELFYLCDDTMAALGKIEIETKEMKPKEIMQDWVEYIKMQSFEDIEFAMAVRSKGKTIQDAIAHILAWSFKNQIPIDKKLVQKAGVSASRVTMGIPGMGTAKQLLRQYYLGE